MTITIRVSQVGAPTETQVGGFLAAIAGPTQHIDGGTSEVEVTIDEEFASGGDMVVSLQHVAPVVANAWREAFLGERTLTDEVEFIGEPAAATKTAGTLKVVGDVIRADIEPRDGDCWALHFEDGSAGLYLFDGVEFQAPDSQVDKEQDTTWRMANSHAVNSPLIASRLLIARGSDYMRAAG